jgi:hypothetical protein
VRRELDWPKKQPTVRLDDPAPGQEAQIDFGLMGTIIDKEGKTRKLHVLIVTLASSRYMFVWRTLRQMTEDVCAGLDAVWRFFGGVPRYTILDNAAARSCARARLRGGRLRATDRRACRSSVQRPAAVAEARQAYGLLRLCYGKDRVNALCARALAFGVLDVPRIERMSRTQDELRTRASRAGG